MWLTCVDFNLGVGLGSALQIYESVCRHFRIICVADERNIIAYTYLEGCPAGQLLFETCVFLTNVSDFPRPLLLPPIRHCNCAESFASVLSAQYTHATRRAAVSASHPIYRESDVPWSDGWNRSAEARTHTTWTRILRISNVNPPSPPISIDLRSFDCGIMRS